MLQVNVEEAKIRLQDLLVQVINGEHFIITQNGKQVAQLVPIAQDGRRPQFGSAKGLITITDDFDASLADHFDAALNEGDIKLKEDPILSVLGVLSGDPLTSEKIDEELYGPFYGKGEDKEKGE